MTIQSRQFVAFAAVSILLLASVALVLRHKLDRRIEVSVVPKTTDTHAHADDPPSKPAQAPPVPGAWRAPAHWEPEPASGMRIASYRVRGAAGHEADVSVIALGASAGTLASNVNRWRGQLGLPPLDAPSIESAARETEGPHGAATFVTLEGGVSLDGRPVPTRMLVGIRSAEGRTVFFKMTGHSDLVRSETPAFERFVLHSVLP